MPKSSHEFALFIEYQLQSRVVITDRDILFRLQQVLRLAVNDTVILFNAQEHARATCVSSDKKQIVFTLKAIVTNTQLAPKIHWILPVLEREAFESALYSATVLGATTIQPVITEKSRHQWGSSKDIERAQRIMIAAAEQSKQFTLPMIKPAQLLSDVIHHSVILQRQSIKKIFFDPTGAPCAQLVHAIKNEQEIVLCIGPEGDLTDTEKILLKNNNFTVYALTPTILRACDAVLVAQGLIRSLL